MLLLHNTTQFFYHYFSVRLLFILANGRISGARTNVCAATCPVVLLTDATDNRIYIPELKGQCSASFLPMIEKTKSNFNRSELPIVSQSPRVQALDDILTAAFTELFVERMYWTEKMFNIVQDGTQDAIRKFTSKF